jgi:hypothetical protein
MSMNKKIIKYIIAVLLIIILSFGLAFIIKNKKPTVVDNKIKTNTTPTINNNKTFVFNNFVQNLEIPKNVKIINKTKAEISDEIINKIVQSFGGGKEIILSDKNIKLYETTSSGASITIERNSNSIEYAKNLLEFPLKEENVLTSEDDLKNKTKQLIKEHFNLDNLGLSFKEIKYEKSFGYDLVSSDKKESSLIELKAVCLFNNYSIYNLGNTICLDIMFTRGGDLVKLIFLWPDNIQQTDMYQQLKSLDEISKIPKTSFEIISTSGLYENSENTDIALEKLENNFSITNAHFGFVNLPNLEYLVPSVIVEGKSVINKETVYVTLAAPILK